MDYFKDCFFLFIVNCLNFQAPFTEFALKAITEGWLNFKEKIVKEVNLIETKENTHVFIPVK